jgi:hypothetical protein
VAAATVAARAPLAELLAVFAEQVATALHPASMGSTQNQPVIDRRNTIRSDPHGMTVREMRDSNVSHRPASWRVSERGADIEFSSQEGHGTSDARG